MIIGSRAFDWSVIKRSMKDPQALVAYCESLIPEPLAHIPSIKDNQRYYVALRIRASKAIPWYHKMEFCKALTNGIQIKGLMDQVYDYKDICSALDPTEFERYLRSGGS